MAIGVGETQVAYLKILAKHGNWHDGLGIEGVFQSKARRIMGTLADRGLARYSYTKKGGEKFKINAAGKKFLTDRAKSK